MSICVKTPELLTFKVNTEINTVLMLINIMIKHNDLQKNIYNIKKNHLSCVIYLEKLILQVSPHILKCLKCCF